MRINLGISTCPNDTFAFHAILNGKVDFRGLQFQIELLDVEQLNTRLAGGDFDVAKASFHAALRMADSVVVLPSGSALGFGVGPLLLAARPDETPENCGRQPPVVLCPGKHTTAAMLYQLFHPTAGEIKHVVFSEIMPALRSGDADFGVCIHEGRFTWQEENLSLVEDLGQRWETETQCPLPLGGIVARKQLGAETIATVQAVVRDSLEYGLAHREETLLTMQRYAQEFTSEVLYAHVDLYVNDWTINLGETGAAAFSALRDKAISANLITAESPRLEIAAG